MLSRSRLGRNGEQVSGNLAEVHVLVWKVDRKRQVSEDDQALHSRGCAIAFATLQYVRLTL